MPQGNNLPAVQIADETVIQAYQSMLMAIPEVEEGSYAGILMQLASATNVYDLDAPFRSDSLATFKDQEIEVRSVRRSESEYEGGLGQFLIVDFVLLASGEKFTLSTGSVTTVAQIARAVSLGIMPFRCIPRVAAKPTKKGFYPQHLEILKTQPAISAEEAAASKERDEAEFGF